MKNKYGSRWPSLRRKVIERDEFKCSSCGKQQDNLDVHHNRPLKHGGNNDESNLETLCKKCHIIVHSAINDMVSRYGEIGVDYFLDESKYAEFMGAKNE